MNGEDNRNDGSMVRAGRLGLAPVPTGNLLVSRGLADLDHGRFLDVRQADKSNERDAAFYYSRGISWVDKEEFDKAISDFDEALRLDPKNADAYHWRGYAWFEKRHFDKAVKDNEEVVRLQPNHLEAHSCVAWLLATCPEEKVRNGKRALQMATKACQLTNWNSTTQLEILAAAYAECGQFEEAERYEIKALEDPDYWGPEGDDFRRRLDLYKQKKPFRQDC